VVSVFESRAFVMKMQAAVAPSREFRGGAVVGGLIFTKRTQQVMFSNR
jgi:hypothetical protein